MATHIHDSPAWNMMGNSSAGTGTGAEILEDLTYSIKHPMAITVIYCLAYGLIFGLGLLGNTLVIAVVIKNPRMQNPTNMFIANLAFADLLVILVCVPATLLVNILNGWILGPVLCKVIPWFQGVSVTASISNLVAISIDRYLAICQSVHIKQSSQTISRTTICLMWVFALAITSPWLSVFKYYRYHIDSPAQLLTTVTTFPPLVKQGPVSQAFSYFNHSGLSLWSEQLASNACNESIVCYTFAGASADSATSTLSRLNGHNLTSLFSPVQASAKYVNVCSEEWQSPLHRKVYFLVIIFGLLYIIPVSIITTCYFLIWKKVCHRNLPGPFVYNEKSQDIVKKSKVKVAQLLFFVMIIFIISWMPLYIYGFRLNFGRETTLLGHLKNSTEARDGPNPDWLGNLAWREILGRSFNLTNVTDCKLSVLTKTRDTIHSLIDEGIDANYALCQLRAPSRLGGSGPDNVTLICTLEGCQEYLASWDASRLLSHIPDERMTTNSYHTHVLSNVIRPLTQWLAFANSCVNPILYTFFHKKYRESFKYLLMNLAYSILLCLCQASPRLSERFSAEIRARKARCFLTTQNNTMYRAGSGRSMAKVSFSRMESATAMGSSVKSSSLSKRSRHSSRRAVVLSRLDSRLLLHTPNHKATFGNHRKIPEKSEDICARTTCYDWNEESSPPAIESDSLDGTKSLTKFDLNGVPGNKRGLPRPTIYAWDARARVMMKAKPTLTKLVVYGSPLSPDGILTAPIPPSGKVNGRKAKGNLKFGRFNTVPSIRRALKTRSFYKSTHENIVHSRSLDGSEGLGAYSNSDLAINGTSLKSNLSPIVKTITLDVSKCKIYVAKKATENGDISFNGLLETTFD